uniref:Immunoglobulin V-set domain-containing protein n=1 Tax=Nothobranchius furzeri TaxID=105023 RepID=A0A8C6LUU5_NOTFU
DPATLHYLGNLIYILSYCCLCGLEGAPVTLSYNYSRDAAIGDYFFWYRQDPGEPPEFLISHTGTETLLLQKVSGLIFTVSDDKRRVDLLISSAAATDSAVYYCAVRPTVTGNSKSV